MNDDKGHIDCSEAIYRMMEYLDGEMTAADADHLREHLLTCGPCLEEHDVDRVLKELVQRSCPCEEAPPTLRTTIMQRITTICDDGAWTSVTQVRHISEG
ncbi:mycothiol system anti-sigma-R factor [Janibacter corallicola]|uniref:mycothiol system anti-sigma-R factor n=1 Tax=Janibacter corallicola TaxID=415212 RepID=UPI000A47109D|nr:mycothiol system anti-sigma-R factor [Janibacter corallicola]